MKHLTLTLAGLSLTVLILTGCTGSPAPDPTSNTSTGSTPTETSSPAPDPTTIINPDDDEAAQAAAAFANVTGDDNMTTSDIQIALLNTLNYTRTFFNSVYLQSGAWVSEGTTYDSLAQRYDRFWDIQYMGTVQNLVLAYNQEQTNDLLSQNSTAFSDLFSQMLFIDKDNMDFGAPLVCENNDTTVSCLTGENVQIDNSSWTYQTVNSDTVNVHVKFTAPLAAQKDGKDGSVPVTYEITYQMVRNESADPAVGFPTFIVKGIVSSNVSAGDFS